MKLSGFSFVKNAIKFDYPVVESIQSILPIVDEFIINIGKSEDNTRQLITKSIKSKKLKIIDSVWHPQYKKNSKVLAAQTDIALLQCTGDWCFYIQADEVFSHKDSNAMRSLLEINLDNETVEGVLVDYRHFFGGFNYYSNSRRWYRKEIRVIRNFLGITSYRDAQGFRLDGRKLNVVNSGLKMHHYGWVRPPKVMAAKKNYHDSLHHGDSFKPDEAEFDYSNYIDPTTVVTFQGDHPPQMQKRIKSWSLNFDPQKVRYKPTLKTYKYRLIDFIGAHTGWYPGEYKNYKVIKTS